MYTTVILILNVTFTVVIFGQIQFKKKWNIYSLLVWSSLFGHLNQPQSFSSLFKVIFIGVGKQTMWAMKRVSSLFVVSTIVFLVLFVSFSQSRSKSKPAYYFLLYVIVGEVSLYLSKKFCCAYFCFSLEHNVPSSLLHIS